jgi:hypothetical protein
MIAAHQATRFLMPSVAVLGAGLLMLMHACTSAVDTVTIRPETCPLPQSLSSEDQTKVKNFGAEISGLMSTLTGGKLQADVESTLAREYPDAADVNRIYALSYSACVACRLDPNDVKGCAQRFDEIIESNSKSAAPSSAPAKDYRTKMLTPLRGSK